MPSRKGGDAIRAGDPIPVSRGYVRTMLQRNKRKWLCKRRRELKKRRLHKVTGSGGQTVLTQFMNLDPVSYTHMTLPTI